jgi:hypothetical protein
MTRRDWTTRLSVATVATIITALLGPFGSHELFSLGERILYWGGLIFASMLPALGLRMIVFRLVRAPILVVDAGAALSVALVFGSGIWAINVFVTGLPANGLAGYGEHITIAVLITLVVVGVRAYIRLDADPALAGQDRDHLFLQRLDPELRAPVIQVTAQDHELEVRTERGQSRLRMRFSDALRELEAFPGIRIHRSHWVARDAIRSVEPDGRRFRVTLTDGRKLPASQSGAEALRQAGLLDP